MTESCHKGGVSENMAFTMLTLRNAMSDIYKEQAGGRSARTCFTIVNGKWTMWCSTVTGKRNSKLWINISSGSKFELLQFICRNRKRFCKGDLALEKSSLGGHSSNSNHRTAVMHQSNGIAVVI